MSSRPLAVKIAESYHGPWVPVGDLAGEILVVGMGEGDEVKISFKSRDGGEVAPVVTHDMIVPFKPAPGLKASASFALVSGQEVTVWAR